jgi:hypothetical protein
MRTIQDHLNDARRWTADFPVTIDDHGWRVTCAVLAEEVSRLQTVACRLDGDVAALLNGIRAKVSQ